MFWIGTKMANKGDIRVIFKGGCDSCLNTCPRESVSRRIPRSSWSSNTTLSKSHHGQEKRMKTWVYYVCVVDFCRVLNLPASRYKWLIWILFNIKIISGVFISEYLHERNNEHLKEYLGMHVPRLWGPRWWLNYFLSSFPALSSQIYTEICSNLGGFRWWWHNHKVLSTMMNQDLKEFLCIAL